MKKKAVKGSLGAIALASAMTMSMGTPVFALELPRPDGYSTEIGGEKQQHLTNILSWMNRRKYQTHPSLMP